LTWSSVHEPGTWTIVVPGAIMCKQPKVLNLTKTRVILVHQFINHCSCVYQSVCIIYLIIQLCCTSHWPIDTFVFTI
jgi:hypothetical protein